VSFSLWQHGAAFALALHLALLWLGFFAARRGLVLAAAGIVWFYAVQLPYMFLPQRELYVEYKAYLPSIGIVLLLADLFRLADRRFGLKLLPAVLVIPLVILGAVTVARNVVYQTPLNLWSDVVAKNPNHYRPHNNLGTALLDLGRYDEAERELRTSLGYWPTNSACYNNLGLIRMKQERYGEARELLLTAIRCWPDSPNAHFNLGNTEWALKRPEAAEKAYREALRLVPDHPQSYNNLANVLAIQGKTDEAIQCYRRALECEPNYLDACKNLVELLMRLNRRAEAAQYYGRLVRLMPAQPVRPLAIARNDYAAVLHETGRTPEAVEQFAEACRLDPGYVQPRFNLATILLSQERWAEAEARYQEVIALDPAHQQAHIRRGFALEKLGRRSEAGAEYRRALELKPTDAQAAWNLAESLADSDKANALIWYQLVCRLEPRNVAALIRAADLLAEQGRRDEAVLLYQAALSVKPDHPRALQQVAAMGTRPAGSAPATPPAAPGEGASSRPR
jgi:tetratricopeptide (TPR) repeat protein